MIRRATLSSHPKPACLAQIILEAKTRMADLQLDARSKGRVVW